ncbi:hypothetical protein Hanom_Chr08g00730791 [Helianthus anomalus]
MNPGRMCITMGRTIIPPPLKEGYCQKKPSGVEKVLNIKLKSVQNQSDHLPDDIDVNYSKTDKSDKGCESEVSSKTHFEDEECFHKNYIVESGTNLNDDPNLVMYKMNGSDKLYSGEEFLIQNVNPNKIEKVFKLAEVDVSETENLASTERLLNFTEDKSFYTKPKHSYLNFQKRNYNNGRNGSGNGKFNQRKRFEKQKYMQKMNFVPETSLESDKES